MRMPSGIAEKKLEIRPDFGVNASLCDFDARGMPESRKTVDLT
jgi:hypothetical protein